MGRLVDIDSLKGCAIIRPTSHESIEYIKQCGDDVLNHNDIPTAYNVDAVIDKLENIYEWNDKKKKECYEEQDWEEFDSYSRINEAFYIAIETVKSGGAT